MEKEWTPVQRVERSILKKYRRVLWNPFMKAIQEYDLIQAGDRIAVCMSGGKDSMLLAKLMQILQRFSTVPFSLEYLVMDPGYSPANRQKILENADLLALPITLFESDIFAVANQLTESPCYLCARMRRGHLYSKAKELGCNKIALGHHFNDVIETTLLGMFYGAQLQAMLPKLHSRNFEQMELIRPLYRVHEEDILAWKRHNHLEFLQCACRFSERAQFDQGSSKRQEIKELLSRLRQENPNIEQHIFTSLHAVCLDTFPGYKTGGQFHSFLEKFRQDAAEN